MENTEIRNQISAAGLKHWQVAKAVGISSYSFCVWMREELTGERLARVQEAIEKLTTVRRADDEGTRA